jgi:hypothetical protein
MTSDPIRVAVFRHAKVKSPKGGKPIEIGDTTAVPLSEALATPWPFDAHFAAYQAVDLPLRSGDGRACVRLARDMVGHVPIHMRLLVGDVDGPDHSAPPRWRRRTERRLRASGIAWYSTRHGYRVLVSLPEAVTIDSPADERDWQYLYLGWREHLIETHGIEIDHKCKDWTRIMRLPNVRRTRRDERSPVHGRIRTWQAGEWLPPTDAPDDASDGKAAAPSEGAAMARARAAAARMPASVEGHGGDEALFRAAREIGTQLGGDAAGILLALTEDFSPRCLPPWPETKLRYEAQRAAQARAAAPVAQAYGERVEARVEAARAPVLAAAEDSDPWATCVDWTAAERPIPYLCEGLRLAPSRGKISLIAGGPGGAKGPLADYLAVCFALGLPAFGQHPCKRSRVCLVDEEGIYLTERRIRRMTRAMGHDPSELVGHLRAIDASLVGAMTDVANLQALERIVVDDGIGVVVLDSYTAAMLSSNVEANSPQFALLAQLLGRLGVLVIAVAHANKATGDEEPRLSDIAYSGAVGAMAQTALVVHYPDPADTNTVRIACARAPETRFAPFSVRFADESDGSLSVTAVEASESTAGIGERATRDLARIGLYVDQVTEALRSLDVAHAGMTARKIRGHLAIPARAWGDVRAELLRRGEITERTLPSQNTVTMQLKEDV